MVRLCSTISYNFFADDKSYIKNKRYGKWEQNENDRKSREREKKNVEMFG